MLGPGEMFVLMVGCVLYSLSWAIAAGAVWFCLREARDLWWKRPRQPYVEVEAEILARYEAGAVQGSELAKARQMAMATWDPLELELRYFFEGREIVSRSRVTTDVYFRSRGMRTLKIQVDPYRPAIWVPLGA